MTLQEWKEKYDPKSVQPTDAQKQALTQWREMYVLPSLKLSNNQTDGTKASTGGGASRLELSDRPTVYNEVSGKTGTSKPAASVQTSDGYYAKPENLWADAESMEQKVTQTANNLKVLRRQVEDLYAAYQKNPTDTAAKMWQDVYGRYEIEYAAYGKYYDAYDAYLTDQQEQYDAWRGTVRTPEQVQQQLAAAQLSIEELEKQRTKANAKFYDRSVKPQEFLEHSASVHAEIDEIDKQLAPLYEKRDLLIEEYDWGRKLEYEEDPHEDIKQNDTLREATWGDVFANSFSRGYQNSVYGTETYKQITGQANNADAVKAILEEDKYQFEADGFVKKAVSGAMEQLGQTWYNLSDPETLALMAGGAATGAGMAFVAGNASPLVVLPEELATVPAGFLYGAGAGYTASATANALEIEAGLAYNEMIEMGISEDTAKAVALAVGGVNAALELFQVDELVKAFKIANKSGATDSILKVIVKELFDRGIDVVKETAQEVSQEGITIAGVQAASKHDKGEWAYEGAEIGSRLGEVAISSALTFAAMNAPAATTNIAIKGTVDAAANQIKKEIMKDRPALDITQISPEKFEPMVEADGRYLDADGYLVMPDGTKVKNNKTMPSTPESREQAKRMKAAKTDTARTGVAAGATDGQIRTAERLSKILGKEIRFYRQGLSEAGTTTNGRYDPKTDVIHVNAASAKGVTWAVAHELTHSTELSSEYGNLLNFVMGEMEKHGRDVDAEAQAIMDLYEKHGEPLEDKDEAKKEILSDFAADYLLTDVNTIRELVRGRPTLGQRILRWIDGILTKGGDEAADDLAMLRTARDMYASALADSKVKRKNAASQTPVSETAQNAGRNFAEDGDVDYDLQDEQRSRAGESMLEDDAGYDAESSYGDSNIEEEAVDAQIREHFPDAQWSITVLEDGKMYVNASRNVIKGTTVAEMRRDITNFFNDLLEEKPSLDIQTIEGDVLTITKADTADKARDDHKIVAGKRVKMTDQEFAVKLRVESHIDEVAEISRKIGSDGDHKNHTIARDGFTYRKSYFEDFDGQYYEIILSIGNNGTVATVYNVGKIEEGVPPSANIIAGVGSKPLGGTPSKSSISQSHPSVKEKLSVTRTAKEQDAILSQMRSILQNGGTAADLKQYVDTLEAQEHAQARKKPQGTNTQRRGDAASQIVRAAHDAEMSVEEYLRENAELYETEDGWNKDARRALQMEENGRGVKYSISKADIEVLREIPNKSVNAFTSTDIKKTEKWAKKFYKELGTKSPFFRAWFGDWRAYDTEQVSVVEVPVIDISEAVLEKGTYDISDVGWKVHAGKILNDDTRHHSGGGRVNVKALGTIKEILKNAVLLDTVVSEPDTKKKSENTAFLHKFYTMINYGGELYIAKSTVEEYYNEANSGISRRAYNLKAIKIEPAGGQLGITSSSSRPVTDSIISIADLFDVVKRYDTEFDPKPVNKVLLNEDGTPKVFYHGTDAKFTEFRPEEMAHREGSFFFAENREDAEAYGRNVLEVYLTGENLADYDNQPREFYQLRDKRAQVQYLKDRGYDGWYADMDSDGWGELSVFSPTQIKSAADNIGTFDGENPDIRYSITSAETTQKPMLAKRDFRNRLMALMSIPYTEKSRMGDILDVYAGELIAKGTLDFESRRDLFNILYNAGVMRMAVDEYYRDIKSVVAKKKLYVPEEVKVEFGDEWGLFRKKAFAAGVKLTNNANDADIPLWNEELAKLFPETFSEGDTDSRSILERIVEAADKGKGEQVSLAEHAARLADEGFISEKEYLFELERKFDAELRIFAEKAGLEIQIKEETEQKNKKEARRKRELLEEQRWRQAVKERQRDTLKKLQWVKSHRKLAPQELRERFEEILSDIDTYAIGAVNEEVYKKHYGEGWRDFVQSYEDAKTSDPNWMPSAELDKLVKRVNNRKIADLDVDALQDLYNAAVALQHEFYNRKNMLIAGRYEMIDDIYEKVSAEIDDVQVDLNWEGSGLTKFFNGDQLSAVNMLRRMAGWKPNSVLYKMARMLEDGVRDQQRFLIEAGKPIEAFTEKNKDWMRRADGQGKDGIWYTIKVPEVIAIRVGQKPVFGKTVEIKMTPLQKVYMYLESKNAENLRHMMGGRTFADPELYAKGERDAAFENGVKYKLAPETVKAIVADLTARELELAGILETYFNEYAKREINRVSNLLYGYDRAMSQYYAPIYTNQNYVYKEVGKSDATIEGMGILKTRQYAKNPTYNISAIDAFERHAKRTAKFVGLSIPIRNWNMLLNFQEKGNSMRDRIGHKWGGEAKDYIDDLLVEVQGLKPEEKKGVLGKVIDKLYSKIIGAVFALNPSIVLKQRGSLYMAMPELGIENIPSLKQRRHIDADLILKYTSELAWRGMGNATPETKLLRENPNWSQTNEAVRFVMGDAITLMDQKVASVLWPWAENKVRREHPELEVGTKAEVDAGESAFYKKVAEVFNDAVANTQSTSDVLHQSTLRRSKNVFARTFTQFKSDSAQAYNLWRRYVGEAQYLKRHGASKADQRAANIKVGQAVLGILANNAWAAAVSFAMAALKNRLKKYKDDEDEITVGSVAAQMAQDFFEGVAGMVVGGEELAEVIGNLLSGEKLYDLEAPGLDVLNDILKMVYDTLDGSADFCKGLANVIKDGGDVGNYIEKNADAIVSGVKDLAFAAAKYLGGLPAENLEAYLLGPISWISPKLAIAYEDLLESPTKKSLAGLKGKALDQRVDDIMRERDVKLTKDGVEMLAALYDAGHKSAVPSDVPSSITVDGETNELTETQKQKYAEVWANAVRNQLQKVLDSKEFKTADLEDKVFMVSKVYQYGAEFAKNAVFKDHELPQWILEVTEFSTEKMDLPRYLEVQAAYSTIFETEADGKLKALDFARWVEEQNFTAAQKRVVRKCFSHSADAYYGFLESGVSEYNAYRTAKSIAALEPAPGNKSVTAIQKYRAVIDEQLPEAEEMAALSQVMSESDYEKVKAGNAHGVAPGVYVTFKELLPQFDEDGNGSYSQSEVEAAIDSIGSRFGLVAKSYGPANAKNTNLTNAQRAVLWQLANKSWKPEANPYSVWVGREVYRDMHGK